MDNAGFPIVALGASAGGIDAFRGFLGALPADSGMAFILVAHLDPEHPSRLVELLSRDTKVPIHEAAEGTAVQPDHIYVIPPGQFVTMHGGTLHVTRPLTGKTVRLPFDALLASLAEEVGERAVCVVLSEPPMMEVVE